MGLSFKNHHIMLLTEIKELETLRRLSVAMKWKVVEMQLGTNE